MRRQNEPFVLLAGLGLWIVAACGPEASETGAASGIDSATGSTTGSSTEMGTAGATGATTGDVQPSPPPATGIEIVDVTADQGVRVPVAIGGELVGGTERNLPLLQGRNTAIRAFYELDPGFVPRLIFARLTLDLGDGSEKVYEAFAEAGEIETCKGQPQWDCRYGSFIGSFNFFVDGEDIRPQTRYRINLYETAPGHEDTPSDKTPVFPADGSSMILGVEQSYMKMRVVLVPIDHDLGPNCPEPPDLLEPWNPEESDATKADFLGNHLAAHNPVDEVTVQVHDPVSYTGSAEEAGGILTMLQQLRVQDGADPGMYYYGVVRPCDSGPDFSGVALLGGPSKFEASQRVGWGVWHGSFTQTADTFVHEIGHEQGRRHVACSGQEGSPNPSYPDHPEGDTESYGMDVYGPQPRISKPSDHDYMTYCTSTWVSEWGYRLVLPRLETISSWELEDGDPWDGAMEVLHVRIRPDGSAEAFIEPSFWDPSALSARTSVSIEGVDGMRTVEGIVLPVPESADVQVLVPVGDEDLSGATTIRFTLGDRTAALAPAEITRPARLAAP